MRSVGFVKQFIWKACNNLLPTKLNLLKRKMVEEDLCTLCSKPKKPFVLYGNALLPAMYGVKEITHFENGQFSLMIFGIYGHI